MGGRERGGEVEKGIAEVARSWKEEKSIALRILPYGSPGTIKGQLLVCTSGKEVSPWGVPLGGKGIGV